MAKHKDDLEKQAEQAMAELDALTESAPPIIPPSQMVVLLGQQYVELNRRFWALRNQGEVCTIVGDHAEAKQHFEGAKNSWKRMQALRDLAGTRGLASEFTELIAEYEAQEKDKLADIRRRQTLKAAKTGTAD